MSEEFTPPIQTGLHLTVEDGQFKIAVSIQNPTDESISLRTMNGQLFSIKMTNRNRELLWVPDTLTTQAVTGWELKPNSRVTTHFEVPNPEVAREKAEKHIEKHRDRLYKDTSVEVVVGTAAEIHEKTVSDDTKVITEIGVDPDELGIVHVEAGIPSPNNYSFNLSRQYDLRRNLDDLDNELPKKTMEGIERQAGGM